jgi:hypothetical protein
MDFAKKNMMNIMNGCMSVGQEEYLVDKLLAEILCGYFMNVIYMQSGR